MWLAVCTVALVVTHAGVSAAPPASVGAPFGNFEAGMRSSPVPFVVASVVLTGDPKQPGSWDVLPGRVSGAVAVANFSDAINETGWAFLDMATSPTFPSEVQAYAAGYLEAYLSHQRMYETAVNNAYDGPAYPANVQEFLSKQRAWVAQAAVNSQTDPYWYHVGLVNVQLQGIVDAYTRFAPASQALTYEQIMYLNYDTDIDDIIQALDPTPDDDGTTEAARAVRDSHCSAMVRLLPNNSDLLVAHTSWAGLEYMTRVYKRTDFPFATSASLSAIIPGRTTVFSSFPGVVFSGDDFYQLSSGLVVVETTIGNNNQSLWTQYMQPEIVLEMFRNVVANRLATSGETWADLFQRWNSGTYNNEFLITNMGLFTPGAPAPKGTLVLLDQVPGNVQYGDVTNLLNSKGYWASYNTPYFEEIFNVSGWQPLVSKWGSYFTWAGAPRALIFARNVSDVVDIPSFQALMRYNDFRHDPLAACNCSTGFTASSAIATRADLNDPNGTYANPYEGQADNVGIDSKVTSFSLFSAGMASVAQSGPTHDQQPVFKFSTTTLTNVSHVGMPDAWDFPWVGINWGTSPLL